MVDREVCLIHIRGVCKKKDECARYHVPGIPHKENKKLCKFYNFAGCTKLKCKYKHCEEARKKTWDLLAQYKLSGNDIQKLAPAQNKKENELVIPKKRGEPELNEKKVEFNQVKPLNEPHVPRKADKENIEPPKRA